MKPFTKITAVLFGIGAIVHLYRLIFPFKVNIGSYEIPNWASFVFIIVAVVLSFKLWKEAK